MEAAKAQNWAVEPQWEKIGYGNTDNILLPCDMVRKHF
jgi:hypothetical protein